MNNFSNKEYGCDYDSLEVEIQDSVKNFLPLRILEIELYLYRFFDSEIVPHPQKQILLNWHLNNYKIV